MHILVKDDIGRLHCCRKSDVIDVFTRLKECDQVRRLTFIQRLVRFERFVVLKDKDRGRRRRGLIHFGKDHRDRRSKLLESAADTANIRLARIAREEEVLCMNAEPFIGGKDGLGEKYTKSRAKKGAHTGKHTLRERIFTEALKVRLRTPGVLWAVFARKQTNENHADHESADMGPPCNSAGVRRCRSERSCSVEELQDEPEAQHDDGRYLNELDKYENRH